MMNRDYRKDFPILERNPGVIYFDNAATSQRPKAVTDAVTVFYETANANPLRGLYDWSVAATDRYENARAHVARFIGASSPEEIIFTRNTTESLNLAAFSYGLEHLKAGQEITLSVMEHHSNLLPWQMVTKKTGAKLVWLEPDAEGLLTDAEIESKIGPATALVAIGHVSNVLGVTNPVKKIIDRAHANGAVVVVDGAQAVPHMPVDVGELDADFYAFSGHKMLGPMGIGALYVKKEILSRMQPFLTGGEMIEYVTREEATWAELPHRFEAGTVNAAGAVGLDAAVSYLEDVGFSFVEEREKQLTTRLMKAMEGMSHIRVLGSSDPAKHCGIVTFTLEGVHPHDIASVLNEDGICIRAGHHCAQPLMQFLGVGSTARASLYFYNTEEEVDRFAQKLKGVREVMGYGD
ncbi:MAG: cysteine desulfurase [Lachnospiraceae bacterium]|nr:cysteine desulfurase [Lachnospiraceae bacterium]